MGFFDKAKERIARSGEETIRTLPKAEEKKPSSAAPALKRAVLQASPQAPRPKISTSMTTVAAEATKHLDLEAQAPSEQYMGSVFDLGEEPLDYGSQMAEAYKLTKAAEAERFKDVLEVQVSQGQVQDILDLYGIPLTYAVPAEVLMPEDLGKFHFDQQVPVGYDQGQVDAFKEQVAKTLEWCYARLEDRNEHIPRLATTIDKLQVDANNLRFQTEIAHGINIMPTSGAEELQTKLYEARVTIRDLQNQLNDSSNAGFTAHERERFEQLQDEVALLRREKAMAEEELLTLKGKVHLLEQEAELQEEQSEPLPSFEEPTEAVLPDPFTAEETEEELPEIAFSLTSEEPKRQSVFDVEEELPGIEFMDEVHEQDPRMAFLQEDEEDEEDRFLREWRQSK